MSRFGEGFENRLDEVLGKVREVFRALVRARERVGRFGEGFGEVSEVH